MPELKNRRHEWFAYFRSTGLRLEEAYERAGYAPNRSHACRLASRPDVAMRINEHHTHYTDIITTNRQDLIEKLLDLAKGAAALGTPTGIKEARIAYLSAERLQYQVAKDADRDRRIIERQMGALPLRQRMKGQPAEVEAACDPGPEPVFEPFTPIPETAWGVD
jgi:hypothetical protein